MNNNLKAALVSVFIFMLIPSGYARGRGWGFGSNALFDSQPGPWLLSPTSEKVDLSGKEFLEFKWLQRVLFGIDHYDFRLYKGYNMYGRDLIFKQNVPYTGSSIKVKAALFENNQVYTWSVVRVGDNGSKSEKSFYSFKVAKK